MPSLSYSWLKKTWWFRPKLISTLICEHALTCARHVFRISLASFLSLRYTCRAVTWVMQLFFIWITWCDHCCVCFLSCSLFRTRWKQTCLILHLQVQIVSRFYREFVLRGRYPPRDFFADWSTYHAFCKRTGELSNSTELLCHLPPQQTPLGQDQPLFVRTPWCMLDISV